MTSRTLLVVAGLVVIAVAGAAILLATGDSGGEAGSGAHSRADSTAALPSFQSDVAGRPESREQIAKPVEVPHAAPSGAGAAESAAAAAAPDFGPLRKLSGKITRASDSTPLGGVVLGWSAEFTHLTLADGQSPPTAISAENGAFHFEVPVSTRQITLTLPANGATADYPLVPGKDDLDVDIVFDSGFRIEGHVTDGNLTPIAEADVEAGGAKAKTGNDGHFQLRDVWSGKQPMVKVKAAAPMRTRGEEDVLVPRSPAEIQGADLKLLGAGGIGGMVSYSNGVPAPGASVEVVLRMQPDGVGDTLPDLSAQSNEQGLYSVEHVPAGHYLVQAAEASSRKPHIADDGTAKVASRHSDGQNDGEALGTLQLPLGMWMQDVAVEEGQNTRLDVVLPVGAVIAGRVLDDAGRPVADARVNLQRRSHWPAPGMNGHSIMTTDGLSVDSRGEGDGQGTTTMLRDLGLVRTDDRGRYEFHGLSGGEHHLVVTDSSNLLAPVERDLVLRGDERLESVDFTLTAGLTLRTRIVDPDGRPLAGAAVSISALDTNAISSKDLVGKSGADGWFETHGVSPGKKHISISLNGYGYLYDEFDPAAPPSSFTLKPAPKLHGVVVDAATGEPVPAYSLKIEYTNSTMMTDVQPHEGGTFEEDVGDDASCRVTIGAPGYAPLTLENIVPSTTVNRPVQFRLVRQN
jgi:protocatechuate 3,4-dioxygenase beta subunit